jgi:hypothetical protein
LESSSKQKSGNVPAEFVLNKNKISIEKYVVTLSFSSLSLPVSFTENKVPILFPTQTLGLHVFFTCLMNTRNNPGILLYWHVLRAGKQLPKHGSLIDRFFIVSIGSLNWICLLS